MIDFESEFYFPDNEGVVEYDEYMENKLFSWLRSLIYKCGDCIINRRVLVNDIDKNEFVDYITIKTKELFLRIINKTDNLVHKNTVKHIFIICFFITFKMYAAVDYEISYEQDGLWWNGLNLKMLSKAIPYKSEEKNIIMFSKIEHDILKSVDWLPFNLTDSTY